MTTEIINPVIGRVDAVDGPATGMPFLILKTQTRTPVVKDAEELVEDIEGEDVQDGANVDGTAVDDADAALANPGAPAWEAVDAAKARTATSALVQVRDQLKELAAREGAEGDDDAWSNQWNLEDAACALDFALATLAKFAVDEQNEADSGQRDAEADARALGLIKALTRHTTEDTVTDQTPATPVAKAEEGTQVAVYDQNGNLLGSVDSDDLTPLATGPAADSDAATEGDAPTDADPVDPAPAPVAAAADPAPAPAPAPADPAVPAPAADDETVTKSLDDRVAEAVAKALEAAVVTAIEPLVKSNYELTERLQKMEQTPRDSGPMLSGHRPGINGPALRGHTAEETDELRKSLESETDPGKRTQGVADYIRNQVWAGRQ